MLNFGCILNNTEVNQKIKMTNISPLPVQYKWKFVLEKDTIISNLVLPTSSTTNNFALEMDAANNAMQQNKENSENPNDASTQDTKETVHKSEILDNTNELENPNDTQMQASTMNMEGGNNEEKPATETTTTVNQAQENLKDISVVEKSISKRQNKLEELLAKQNELDLPSIEEIFDISPLYGTLHPGETQNLSITYYGHKEIRANVKAVCEVKNGPEYELYLKGEASVLSYELSDKVINLGYVVRIYFFFKLF